MCLQLDSIEEESIKIKELLASAMLQHPPSGRVATCEFSLWQQVMSHAINHKSTVPKYEARRPSNERRKHILNRQAVCNQYSIQQTLNVAYE